MPPRRVCATMHAERLHEDHVWARVQAALHHEHMPWTVFVESLGARIAHFDLGPRLRWLADHGHEIEMHTHHRRLIGPAGAPSGFVKQSSTAEADVRRCMDEGLEYLNDLGFQPVGFAAGSWLVLGSTFEWLREHGFAWDVSLRTYQVPRMGSDVEVDRPCPGPRTLRGVLEVPTTATLKQHVKARVVPRGRGRSVAGPPYDLFYLHDYDLLSTTKLRAVDVLGLLQRRSENLTVRELIERLGTIDSSGA
jgi:peptidoglycan/xylan/chitin deacetylase (PgdA/CDA1 family)